MAILQSYYQDVYRSPVVRLSGYSGRHELASSILAYLEFGGATGTCKDGVAETMLAFATERNRLSKTPPPAITGTLPTTLPMMTTPNTTAA